MATGACVCIPHSVQVAMHAHIYYMVCVHQQIWQLNWGNLGESGNTTQQSTAIPPRHGTHRCKQPASPSCSLDQPLCTRTFHLGFVRNCGSWDMLSYHHQQLVDSPHPRRPSIPVGLVGCTTLLKWALVLCLVRSTLSHSLRRSAPPSMVCQTGECRHTAGKLQTLQCERRCQEEQLNRGVECQIVRIMLWPSCMYTYVRAGRHLLTTDLRK